MKTPNQIQQRITKCKIEVHKLESNEEEIWIDNTEIINELLTEINTLMWVLGEKD